MDDFHGCPRNYRATGICHCSLNLTGAGLGQQRIPRQGQKEHNRQKVHASESERFHTHSHFRPTIATPQDLVAVKADPSKPLKKTVYILSVSSIRLSLVQKKRSEERRVGK